MSALEEAVGRARAAYQAREFDKAAEAFNQALSHAPDHLPSPFGLGNSLLEAKRDSEALAPLEKALEIAPGNADIHNSIGVLLRRLKRYAEAIPHLEAAAEAHPDQPGIVTNLANAYRADYRLAEAIAAYERALEQDDTFAEAYAGLGTTHRMTGQLENAKTMLDRALTLNPGHADARFSRALLYLEQGNLPFGFADYEQRWASSDFPGRSIAGAQWRGKDLNGRTILVHAEQGFGDTIQFARFVPMLAARGAKVLFYAQPELIPLIAGLSGVAEAIPAGRQEVPAYDYYVAVMSLPYHFGTTPESIPSEVPDVSPPSTLPGELEQLLPLTSDSYRVGLVWAGRANHTNDRHRSCRLTDLSALLDLPGISYFSLQKESKEEDRMFLRGIVDLSPHLTDFSVTAAFMERLDLIVCVDTAPAHLAGALGRPIWLMLPHRGEWRWALAQDSSPWYPSMRIFRQSSPGDWKTLVESLKTELIRQAGRTT